MKHSPIESIYSENFVVEHRVGQYSYRPHVGQLASIYRILNFEFRSGLPERIARVDRRGSAFDKMQLHLAAMTFCSFINARRSDGLRMHTLASEDLVARISIAQHITEHAPKGNLHRFKFFAGADFIKELYLNGKKLVFATHALERFSERVPHHLGTDVTGLFGSVLGCATIIMRCNSGTAFVYNYRGSIVAFPFEETSNEFLILTCLSINEIDKLEPLTPTEGYCPTYEPAPGQPLKRNWDVARWTWELMDAWHRKFPPQPPLLPVADKSTWSATAHRIKNKFESKGMNRNSMFEFYDYIPGPCTIRWRSEADKNAGFAM